MDVNTLLTPGRVTGDVAADITEFLTKRGLASAVLHVRAVAGQAGQIARHFGANLEHARLAGWLHDVAAVVPESRMVEVADTLGIVLTPADRAIPQVIHGRISAWLGEHRFGISDPVILDAVRCHTTLRYGASDIDKVLFVADKTALDPTADFRPGYYPALTAAAEESLDRAAFVVLDWFYAERERLGWRLHPDLLAAHTDLAHRLGVESPWQAAELAVRWDAAGLAPAVVQDAATGAVLTVAYMDRTALRLTLATGESHFWSRSRREIWHKGRTSGHTQSVVNVAVDCDGDALLVRVHPHGPACHTGAATCFFSRLHEQPPADAKPPAPLRG